MLKLKQVTPPAVEPVTLGDVKPQLKIDTDDHDYDDVLSPLIVAAREWCEGYQNRAYITQSFELALNGLSNKRTIRLPRPPLQSVDAVRYTDRDGVIQTWPVINYGADTYSEPGNIYRKSNWPQTNCETNNVIITYTAGYGGSATNVPQKIKQAIILLTMHWFANGMCDPPVAVYALLDLDRVVPL